MTRLSTIVELRGLEPLTSSMPWWPEMHRRRAASLDEVHGRAGATTCIQPGSPSVCPPWRTATEAIGAAILSLGRHPTAVRWAELIWDRKPLVPVRDRYPPLRR